MNKHYYRLVFNKAKGRLVVVSEAATAERHGSKVTPRRRLRRLDTRRCFELGILRPLTWSILLSIGLVSLPVHAQIAPDRSAPGSQRPHVVNSANGTPQANITSPNSKGVSRNTYRQFDVDGKGAILNNARSATSTQIGGWVQGNPNLANGEARVIVNEVNSSNPSRLHGAVEVAGRRAEVVIANPAGIDVDGAGFINAQGITLTTGQPQFNNGALDSYRVEGGTVRIHGDGFDAGDADYAAILARAAEVKAGVWAEEIDVVAGANRISADRQTINTIDGHGKSPSVGIDVAHLGGMYAGKIHLMATERGVGVNHAGDMVADELVLDADGRITNRGQIAAQGDMQLTSRDDIANHGSLRAGDEIVVTSDGELANRDSGTIIAKHDIQLSAADLTSDSGSLIAAGVRDDGSLETTGDLTMSAGQGIDGSGRHIAAGGFYAQAETVALRESHTQASDIDIIAGREGIDASAASLTAEAEFSAKTSGTLRTDNASVVAETLNLDVGSLSNIGGDILQFGEQSLELRFDTFDNASGRFASNARLDITASSIDNREGDLVGEQGVALRAASLDNRWGTLGAINGQLQVEAGALDNTLGRVETTGDLSLDIASTLGNQNGEIVHAGDGEARIDATRIDGSDGLIASQGKLTMTADSLDLDGAITSARQIAVHAERLSHYQGEMSQHGDNAELLLATRETLDNREGKILSHADLSIKAGDLVNLSGMLQAARDLSLVSGELDNRQGEILTGERLAFDAGGQLDNRDGEIVATWGDINTQGRRLNNRGGLIAAREALELTSGVLDNKGGTLQSGSDLSLDTHGQALLNTGAGAILGEDNVSLAVGSLDNTSGMIGAGTRLDLQADTIINRNGGALLSEADMKATAASLDNGGGQLQAQGDMNLDLDTTLGNQSGLILAGQMLEVSAKQVINQHTQGNGKGIEAHSIHLKADELDNRQGAIRTDTLADLQIENGVNNRNGLISSLDTLVIKASDIDNGDGTLVADRALDLTTVRLADDGRMLSLGDLALRLASDYTLSEGGELMAAGDLQLASSGTVNNRGKLRAGDALSIEATRLSNAASGELSGNTTYIDTAHLTNRGLIDGIDTHIAADVLDNLGTGRVYGDRLAIEADTLTNDNEQGKAAVMAARERLDLGIDRLINRDDALIFSAGDMAIGGSLNARDKARGQADRVENASATIEALGNLNLSTARLDNINEHFETELIRVADLPEGKYIQPVGWDEKAPVDDFTLVSLSGGYSGYRHNESGVAFSRWTEYNIERSQYDSQVVRSQPGQLLAGGNLHLTGGDLVNDKSRIVAGGMVHGDLNNLSNIEAVGQRTFDETGTSRESSTYTRMECSNGQNCGPERVTYRRYSDWEPYSGQSSEAIIVPITEVREGSTFSGSGTQLGAHHGASLDASAQGAHRAQVNLHTRGAGDAVIEVPALSPPTIYAERLAKDLMQFGVIRSVMPDINLPTNSLFQINPAPKSHYLVETDPRFTNQREWLGSDYMLDALNSDPSTTHKRLGDGFYEQRMINEQVMQLTGQRYLTGYGNDDDQYRALMNAGVTFAEEHGLRPGVALTAEQMAQLTSDIVWLVEQEVTQEDGSITKVLVPQVYARVREGDLQGDGTLLAGNSLALDVKNDIVNTGALAGRELVDMSADNLTNLEGRISGNRVDLRSRRDLTNLGGDITANESMSLQAGRDLNLASTSERLAGLYVTEAGGSLSAAAGRDLNVRGADLDSAGDLQLGAGRDLDIASTMSREQRWGGVSERSELERGASLSAGSDLILDAGRDLTLTAVDVSAGGDGLPSAGRDLTLETLTPQESLKTWRNPPHLMLVETCFCKPVTT